VLLFHSTLSTYGKHLKKWFYAIFPIKSSLFLVAKC
jgi:hypothetical protein